ncbi:MAG: mitomycin antibiotics/polyketide fumonisin biosynthesis protein [Candidatus Latescibacteria bacterium]|jgi:ectoine hydroxylase-related dioxygenase (phytanoyl-CoA dioxygenase family)|nr:mitomycin antibiotics/polyketide fumonisin biosynthesis protein [Candidatus Latescibacterota bacterium]
MAAFEERRSLIDADENRIQEWVATFHRQGYLFLEQVLPLSWCEELKNDLDRALEKLEEPHDPALQLVSRMFEQSTANLRLFDLDPIADFAEALVSPDCHVIHNNSFLSHPGSGITTWHQDDAPHYVVNDGKPPDNIHLPVLFFTANYYLTDVTKEEHDGTEVIPGSHLFGQPPPDDISGTPWESTVAPNFGKAGSVVMFNNQVWHRGGKNMGQRTRYITQVTYARRIIGHMYYPFMNYEMPEHVHQDADPRLKRLLGFLPHGAYG